jgi:hypothetical protein
VSELGTLLWQLVVAAWDVFYYVMHAVLPWTPAVAWFAWWLWGVNWSRAWQVLRGGAWVPLVLLGVLGALAWSELAPGECTCVGFVRLSNFWWQLGAVGLLAALTLFCGWIQGRVGWGPAEMNLDPPELAHADAGHGHGHP